MNESTAPAGPVALAMREARALHHDHVGTEHLLLGLLLDENGEARRILNELGVTAERYRVELRRTTAADAPSTPGRLPFTPRVRQTLEACADVARRTRARSLRSEHLLLGLLEQTDGLARRALLDFDVDVEVVRRRTLAVLANAESMAPRGVPQKAEITALDAFGEDWTASPDRDDAPDPALDAAALGVLARRRRRAVLLLGAEGGGKSTALRRIARAISLAPLGPRRLVAIQVGGVIAGARHRGRVEERVRALFAEAFHDNVALAFDDLEGILAWPEFARALELSLRAMPTPVLATLSTRFLPKLLDRHAALLTLFEPMSIAAPKPSDKLTALSARARSIESHHGVKIPMATRHAALAMTTHADLAEAAARLDHAAAARRALALRPTTAIRDTIAEALRWERESERAAAEGDEVRRADCVARGRAARESARALIVVHAGSTAGIELSPADLASPTSSTD